MKVTFFHSDKRREVLLANAFKRGIRAHGDKCKLVHIKDGYSQIGWGEVACMVGVKSARLWQLNRQNGIQTIYLDKGYSRHRKKGLGIWEYWRVSVNAHQPTEYLRTSEHDDIRWNNLGLSIRPWREDGDSVLFAGSSLKCHNFYGMEHPSRYAENVIRGIKRLTDRPIVYRPKPSWLGARRILDTRFSTPRETIKSVLLDAHCLVTHSSNACFEAMIYGVPSIILGNAVAKPISSTTISEIENPRRAKDQERRQLLNNLSYCQWTLDEFSSGEAWAVIRPQL